MRALLEGRFSEAEALRVDVSSSGNERIRQTPQGWPARSLRFSVASRVVWTSFRRSSPPRTRASHESRVASRADHGGSRGRRPRARPHRVRRDRGSRFRGCARRLLPVRHLGPARGQLARIGDADHAEVLYAGCCSPLATNSSCSRTPWCSSARSRTTSESSRSRESPSEKPRTISRRRSCATIVSEPPPSPRSEPACLRSPPSSPQRTRRRGQVGPMLDSIIEDAKRLGMAALVSEATVLR